MLLPAAGFAIALALQLQTSEMLVILSTSASGFVQQPNSLRQAYPAMANSPLPGVMC